MTKLGRVPEDQKIFKCDICQEIMLKVDICLNCSGIYVKKMSTITVCKECCYCQAQHELKKGGTDA